MGKNSVADLLSVDNLFTTQAERDEATRESILDIPLNEISDFPDHPFKVRMDENMMDMVESVKQYGVLVPALVRPKPDGGYEMIAGHRRKMASELAGKPILPSDGGPGAQTAADSGRGAAHPKRGTAGGHPRTQCPETEKI